MKTPRLTWFFAVSLMWSVSSAQQGLPAANSAVVPRLVNFSGKATDGQGKTLSGVNGATFAIYKDQEGGSPLWLESQTIQADTKGNYTVQLGATQPYGLPLDLFSTGEGRWLGVTINGGTEQPRVLLLSVPYALKAADAETVGGFPPTAFVLAAPPNSASAPSAPGAVPANASPSPLALAGGGTLDFVPLWTPDGNTLGNSVLFQSGSGSTAKVGINTTAPAATLDVKGGAAVRGNLTLPAIGTATTSGGKNSQPTTLTASAFNSTAGTAVSQNFRWQSEPTGNNTSSPGGTLNLLFGSGSSTPSETGLHVSSKGQITFASGQTFPGTGSVSSVGLSAPPSDFTVSGSPITNSGTLALSWAVPPTSADTANAIVKRDSSGSFYAGTINSGNIVAAGAITATFGITAPQLTVSNPAGVAVVASTSSANPAIMGTDTSGAGVGVQGTTSSGTGVLGTSTNSSQGAGVIGISNQYAFGAVQGLNTNSTGSTSSFPSGVYGASGSIGTTIGVWGYSPSATGVGVAGEGNNGGFYGFSQLADSLIGTAAIGTLADSAYGYGLLATSDSGNSLVATNTGSGDTAVITNQGTGFPLYASSPTGSMFLDNGGNLNVSGAIFAGKKDFKIDHPLDPANKYLVHASIESSEMLNLYTGNVTTDSRGEATVQLPAWFEALNTDFRYQVTVIGQFAQAIIARKIENRQFAIRTNAPNVEVSWQVTGVRQDAYAKAHPLQVEQQKEDDMRGFYIHPELYGASAEKGRQWAHHPELMKGGQEIKVRKDNQGLPRTMLLPPGSH